MMDANEKRICAKCGREIDPSERAYSVHDKYICLECNHKVDKKSSDVTPHHETFPHKLLDTKEQKIQRYATIILCLGFLQYVVLGPLFGLLVLELPSPMWLFFFVSGISCMLIAIFMMSYSGAFYMRSIVFGWGAGFALICIYYLSCIDWQEGISFRFSKGLYFLVILGVVSLLYSSLILLVLIYRMWAIIPPNYARTRPEKAVGFLFIPLFNLYWIIQVFWGWACDYNRFAVERCISVPRMPSRLVMCWCIITLLGTHPNILILTAWSYTRDIGILIIGCFGWAILGNLAIGSIVFGCIEKASNALTLAIGKGSPKSGISMFTNKT